MAFRGWDTPYRPFRLGRQLAGTTFVCTVGAAAFFASQALWGSQSSTVNREWESETAKYAIAIKADPISRTEVRGNLADTPIYDYWEKKKAAL